MSPPCWEYALEWLEYLGTLRVRRIGNNVGSRTTAEENDLDESLTPCVPPLAACMGFFVVEKSDIFEV
jgi:hypothetical protein